MTILQTGRNHGHTMTYITEPGQMNGLSPRTELGNLGPPDDIRRTIINIITNKTVYI